MRLFLWSLFVAFLLAYLQSPFFWGKSSKEKQYMKEVHQMCINECHPMGVDKILFKKGYVEKCVCSTSEYL